MKGRGISGLVDRFSTWGDDLNEDTVLSRAESSEGREGLEGSDEVCHGHLRCSILRTARERCRQVTGCVV